MESQISGDWFDIRERLHKIDDLKSLLWGGSEPDPTMLADVARELDGSVEEGTAEFKRGVFRRLAGELEEAAFSSEIFHQLPRTIARLQTVLLVTSIQRGILSGEIRLVPDENEESPKAQDHLADAQIKSIVADVQEIVANDPSARMNSAIKNILMQLHKYRDEVETFNKLKEKTDPERLEAITQNFRTSFSRIFASIRKNYGQFQEDQRLAGRRERGAVLAKMESTALQKHLVKQLEEISRVRSTLRFIYGENYQMREPLVKLGQSLSTGETLCNEEISLAQDISGGERAGEALLKMLAREIARLLREN